MSSVSAAEVQHVRLVATAGVFVQGGEVTGEILDADPRERSGLAVGRNRLAAGRCGRVGIARRYGPDREVVPLLGQPRPLRSVCGDQRVDE